MAVMRFRSQQDADEFQKQIAQAALRWGRPVWWYDWGQPFEKLEITGATCFVLKFKARYVGVTAAHVVKEILKARQYTILRLSYTTNAALSATRCHRHER